MKDLFNSGELYGFGGLLILFQISLYMSILKPILMSHTLSVLSYIFIALIVICLILFYMRSMLFRVVYMIIVGLIVIIYLKYIPYSMPYIIEELIEGGLVITYLFMSERVRNTFN